MHFHAKSNAQNVRLANSHEILLMNRQGLVAQGIVDAVPRNPFVIKVTRRSYQQMTRPKEMIVAACLDAATQGMESQDPVAETHFTVVKYIVNATQIYDVSESKKKDL